MDDHIYQTARTMEQCRWLRSGGPQSKQTRDEKARRFTSGLPQTVWLTARPYFPAAHPRRSGVCTQDEVTSPTTDTPQVAMDAPHYDSRTHIWAQRSAQGQDC